MTPSSALRNLQPEGTLFITSLRCYWTIHRRGLSRRRHRSSIPMLRPSSPPPSVNPSTTLLPQSLRASL